MQHELSTGRLSLSLLQASDFPFIRQLVNTAGWLAFIGDRNIHSDADARVYVDRIIRSADIWYWVVREKSSMHSIGIVTFLKRTYLPHFDLGFAFLPEYTGVGYAYEAARAVLDMVTVMPRNRIVLATTVPENERSIRQLEKLGFRFDKQINENQETLLVYRFDA